MISVEFALKLFLFALVLNIGLGHGNGKGNGSGERGRGGERGGQREGHVCPVSASLTNCSDSCNATAKRACGGEHQLCCPSSCSSTVCAVRCRQHCRFGFSGDSVDAAGCRNATCNPNPCEPSPCGTGLCQLRCVNANENPCTSWQSQCCTKIACPKCPRNKDYAKDPTTGCQANCTCVAVA